MPFKGVITALVTPFLKGEVDKKSFVRLIQQGLNQGVDGFVINGTTGESPCLTQGEVQTLCEIAQTEVSGQVPLILGIGHNNTQQACLNMQQAATLKVDGALGVVPYYNKPTQEGLIRHYKEIAKQNSLSLLLYNVPSRTSLSLEVTSILELSKVKNIVGIKEASGDLSFDKQLLSSLTEDFLVISGDDSTFLDLVDLGGEGVISVCSHFLATPMKQALEESKNGNKEVTLKFKNNYDAIISELYKVSNPIMIKQVLYMKGWIQSPELRLPLCEPQEPLKRKMKTLLEKLESM